MEGFNIRGAEGARGRRRGSAAASARGTARPPARAPRARKRGRAAACASASRAARCRCSAASRAAGSPTTRSRRSSQVGERGRAQPVRRRRRREPGQPPAHGAWRGQRPAGQDPRRAGSSREKAARVRRGEDRRAGGPVKDRGGRGEASTAAAARRSDEARRMANPLVDIFRVKELRDRILFTIGILVIYRLGTILPVPGINIAALKLHFARRAVPARWGSRISWTSSPAARSRTSRSSCSRSCPTSPCRSSCSC